MPGADASGVVAVDWGTSSFRLWVLDRDGAVLSESRGPEGMSRAATLGFPEVLSRHLERAKAPAGLPVVIAGMAGARQGWTEAAYMTTGAPLVDLAAQAVAVPFAGREVHILPGVAQDHRGEADVMRGEETQLLGLLHSDAPPERVVMPGTHSKWVSLQDGAIARFTTYLTGELFGLLTQHSTLAPALETSVDVIASADFEQAVGDAFSRPAAALEQLFGLRAGGLLGHTTAEVGRVRLSGLLIGAEIGLAAERHGLGPVTLVASGSAAELYGLALRKAGLPFTLADAAEAARSGLRAAARSLYTEYLS